MTPFSENGNLMKEANFLIQKNKLSQLWLVFFSIAILFILGCYLSLRFGAVAYTNQQVLSVLRAPLTDSSLQDVIFDLRLPRIFAAILVGAAMAQAGSIIQGVTRNPIADPWLLGINAGSSFALAVCLAFLPGMSFSGIVMCSFLGAGAALLLVYGLMSLRHKKLDPVRLVLAGSAVSIFLSSICQAISLFCNIGYDLTFWTAGGVAGIRMKQLTFAVPGIAAGLLLALLLSKRISLLSLGDDAARGLGIKVERTKTLCLATVLLLAGSAVALAGPVSFVGLLVPHVVRFFAGSDYGTVIPGSMITGAVFMLLADIISRVINAPSETPVGLVFAVVGVPFFIWTARKGADEND